MPQRTNEFQGLINLLERQLAPTGATIKESKLLTDRVTGEQREVDVVIQHNSGIHPICIGIEVISHKRPASSTWIETIADKHRDLPIDKTIAVSKSGFYKPALKKAKSRDIDTLTLREATELDWPSKLDRLPGVQVHAFLVPYLTHATLVLYKQESLANFTDVNMWNVKLYSSAGELLGTLKEILGKTISSSAFVDTIEEKAFIDSATAINAELRLSEGTSAESPDQERHPVRSIKFQATCKKVVSDANLQKGPYRDVAVALASGSALGFDFQMAFSQQKNDKNAILGLQITKCNQK